MAPPHTSAHVIHTHQHFSRSPGHKVAGRGVKREDCNVIACSHEEEQILLLILKGEAKGLSGKRVGWQKGYKMAITLSGKRVK